jgi:hypothetical protein
VKTTDLSQVIVSKFDKCQNHELSRFKVKPVETETPLGSTILSVIDRCSVYTG